MKNLIVGKMQNVGKIGIIFPQQFPNEIPNYGPLCKVEIDLNMIPGLLALKNCKNYSLRIYPETFPENQIGDRIGKKWTQGNVTDFTYIVPTNKNDLENDIEFNLDDLRCETFDFCLLSFCQNERIQLSQLVYFLRKVCLFFNF